MQSIITCICFKGNQDRRTSAQVNKTILRIDFRNKDLHHFALHDATEPLQTSLSTTLPSLKASAKRGTDKIPERAEKKSAEPKKRKRSVSRIFLSVFSAQFSRNFSKCFRHLATLLKRDKRKSSFFRQIPTDSDRFR